MEESREFLPFVYGFEKGKITSDYAKKQAYYTKAIGKSWNEISGCFV
ncbi:MAG: hypothetical protein IPJ32_18775 [Sphingobacteriaceae bacterium]|nr:hypothetical protein [Sphingobacteriaceae bacterium]